MREEKGEAMQGRRRLPSLSPSDFFTTLGLWHKKVLAGYFIDIELIQLAISSHVRS